jgi:hypothetical protein
VTVLADQFLNLLRSLAADRPHHSRIVPSPLGGGEPAWVGREAAALLAEINAIRAAHGHRPVGVHVVRAAEHRTAVHHSGTAYDERYAARCAALANGADHA